MAHRGTPLPADTRIDARLVAGVSMFCLGWGLAGLCPGVVMVVLGFGGLPYLIFFVDMGEGMMLFATWDCR